MMPGFLFLARPVFGEPLGKAPYEAEEGPAQGAAQGHERERRITPGDQQVDVLWSIFRRTALTCRTP
jgi:hypothetical protein